jgi:ring-1,2-phenylacetyl-CoA epoxidase subunit PaaC
MRLGRDGAHTEALAEILGEMQALARSLPGGVW